MSSPVPNVPPLVSVSDPATRRVLQAMLDRDRVRSGEIGDGTHKWLTVADLSDGINAMGSTGGVPSLSGSASGGDIKTKIANVLASLKSSTMESRLWKLLGDRLDKIETPEWFAGKVGAAMKEEQTLRETALAALAQKTTTVITQIGEQQAIAQHQLKATSDKAGATASALTNLQTTVGEVAVRAQEALTLSQTIEQEIEGAWTVKFDVNGYVTGAGLSVSAKGTDIPSSAFIVRADRFVIGSPQHPNIPAVTPFTVITVDTVVAGEVLKPGIYVTKAYIEEAWIGTLHLKEESVTTMARQSFAGTNTGDGGTWTSGNTTFDFPKAPPQSIIFLVTGRVGTTGDGSVGVRIKRTDGVQIFYGDFSLRGGYVTSIALSAADEDPKKGVSAYYMELTGVGGTWSANPISIVALVNKR